MMTGSAIPVTGRCTEVRAPAELTQATAPAVARAVAHMLRERARHLWLNLEHVTVVDAVGLAVVAQAVERATARGRRCRIFPSGVVFRGLFQVGLLDHLPVDERRGWERASADVIVEIDDVPTTGDRPLSGDGIHLARPVWDDLRLLEGWAHDAGLVDEVGSQLLDQCRHFGPHDPDFVASCLGSATSLLLLIRPGMPGAPPVGYVRLHGVHLGQRIAVLETVVVPSRARRIAWGIEASRLALQYAVDALGLHRIETKVYADNVLCINALRRHGFTLEGRLREARVHAGRRADILVFGVLQEQVRAGLARAVPDLTLWPDEPLRLRPERLPIR